MHLTLVSIRNRIDIGHFIEYLNQRDDATGLNTHLKTIRENRGISQAELANLSGVSLRPI